MENNLGKIPFDLDFHPTSPLVAVGLISGDFHLNSENDSLAKMKEAEKSLESKEKSSSHQGEMDERPMKGDSQEDDLVLSLRRLEISDNAKGFVDLLSQLSSATTPLMDADFRARFAELAALGDNHFVVVAEDRRSGRIVATGSVFLERKFLRGGGKVGHIEDVVVDSAFRGRHLGQRVVGFLRDYAKAAGCYKVILNNTTDLRSFYEKCGFTEKNIQMVCYF